MQRETTSEYIIPFIESVKKIDTHHKILEIGCGEAGVLEAFLLRSNECFGVDLNQRKIELAKTRQKNYLSNGQIQLLNDDVQDPVVQEKLGGPFDVILLKDVIEHIPNQEEFIPKLKSLLAEDGVIFFGSPPMANALWWSSSDAQQQVFIQSPIFSSLTTQMVSWNDALVWRI